MQAGTFRNAKELVPLAVQANKEHQYALKVYTERLEAELEHLDKLLDLAAVSEDEEDETVAVGGNIIIPGAKRPRGVIPHNDLVSETSPFYHDALRKRRYEELTVVHPMKSQEIEALADAVRSENYRLYALQAQAQGLQPFTGLGDPPPGFINNNKRGIDWERVAQKVSSASPSVQRTAKECEIRWLGDRHPEYNHAQWTQAEIAKVRELVGDAHEGQINWVDIAEKLGTKRTPMDCMRHAIVRKTHSWTPDADQRLLEAVDIYGADNWALVARWVSEDATPAQCQNRYMRTLDPSLKRGPWTPDEDERLKEAVAVFGHSWIDVAAFVEGRNNEQCRDRYQEYLNPSVTKGRWTVEDDAALLRAVEQVGLGKWKEVSQILNIGRTDNMCRMRYGVLTKSKRLSQTASPIPMAGETTSVTPAQSTSKGPSRASTKQLSGQSTPSERSTEAHPDQHQPILLLHPESYVPCSSSNVPVPSAKPKPRPRPRKRNPSVAEENLTADAPAVQPVATSSVTHPSNDSSTGNMHSAEEESLYAGPKRPGLKVDSAESQPSKRRRTERSQSQAPTSVPISAAEPLRHPRSDGFSQSPTSPEPAEPANMTVPPSGQADVSLPTEISADGSANGASASWGRGRGRGGGGRGARARGRGRGRARRGAAGGMSSAPSVEDKQPTNASEPSKETTNAETPNAMQASEPPLDGDGGGQHSSPPRTRKTKSNSPMNPPRRQPPRAANKASRISATGEVAGS